MKKLSSVLALPAVVALCFMVCSCGNNNSSSSESSGNADTTTQKTTDTTAKTTTPAAPEGKTATGTNIEIHAVGNNMSEMRYDVSEIDAPANSKMKITLIDDATDPSMMHNIVIVKAGTMDSVASQGIKAGIAKDFVPDDPDVIAHSGLTKPGGKAVLEFTTPAAGEYNYMCTYPGHFQRMHGKLVVK